MTEKDPLLSIIIVSYNTRELTLNCIKSIINSVKDGLSYELIVVDNNSTDDTMEKIEKLKIKYQKDRLKIKIFENKDNVGFAKANNQGIRETKGNYILFLNSDTVVPADFNWKEVVGYLGISKPVGALTVKVELENGMLDPASHRGFPSLWRSFCYFSGLEKISTITGLAKGLFGGYHLLYKNLNAIHEIDSPSGAFYLLKKEVLYKTGGFDEDFFMYGEDLDLSWRVKKAGYKIEYYPHQKIIHLKYRSGLKASGNDAIKTKNHFFDAMDIFFQKHYAGRYPAWFNLFVYKGIKVLKMIRK